MSYQLLTGDTRELLKTISSKSVHRKYIGIELSEAYQDIAKLRLEVKE